MIFLENVSIDSFRIKLSEILLILFTGEGTEEIVLNEELAPGLQGLESLEYMAVLFNFHKSEGFDLLQHRRGDKSVPKVGVFATRSPFRPNSIGLSVVKILEVSGNIIRFEGADMLDGTPVLDIKPHIVTLKP